MAELMHPNEFDSCIRCNNKPLSSNHVCHHCDGTGVEKGWNHPTIDSCTDCHGYGSLPNGFVCDTCDGAGTASKRVKEVIIDASGPCNDCSGQGAHELGPILSGIYNGCGTCQSHGTASGGPKIIWYEFTQEEHDAHIAAKLEAQKQAEVEEAAKAAQKVKDETDKAILNAVSSTLEERIMALTRLNRHI